MANDKTDNQQLLPEERVRQWFIGELVAMGIEKYRISTEYSVMVSGRRLRVDIVIYGRGSREIVAIVECKAASVPLTEKVITQAAVYNTVVGARWIIATNGLSTYIYDTADRKFIASLPSI